ncbi:hypothetical protein [Stackebrandtia nassauensis]|uniref:DUF3352 domain-containing protein n=1 Tax=Stackebrandtia nassauensis (strain DSM 44728 / CIP 108903 / NRRL B-16338 / NBRC 102104 / LLR-40K-21) TaxID=446470 RepID=D3Q7A8_STANL|nr:hypothetical protein [Stackebrandtia nassauensis]ADD42379.1 hypothetical protein Snas_2702 [Stackebrandtia nassauensis DSM 44728]
MSKRKRPKKLVIGVATALALAIGGGGAWAGTSYLGTDGTDPESRLPASTAAFASFNLDVSKEQQQELLELVAKFPSAAVDSDLPQEAVSRFLEMLEKKDGDFADGRFSEWVGPNASVALWEYKGEPYGLASVSSIDDSKAEDGLAAVKQAGGNDQVGYQVKDGYATIAFGEKGAQKAAKTAVSEAEKAPLSESDRFAKADSFLGDDKVLSAWADLEQSYELLEKKLPEDGGGLPFDALKVLKNNMNGQIAVGAQARDYGIEAVSSTFGAKDVIEGKKGMIDDLSQLPESDIGAALALPQDVKESILMVLVNSGFGEIGEGLDNVIMDKVSELLSGASGTLSVNGVKTSTPSGMAVIETTSPDKARALKALADLAGGALKTSVEGSTITGSTVGYSGDGKISDNKYYKDAVGGAVDKLNGAVFVDVTKMPLGNAEQALEAVKAIGITHGTKGGEYVGNYRLIVD